MSETPPEPIDSGQDNVAGLGGLTPSEARSIELRDIQDRTMHMPDGSRLIIAAETDGEVMATEVSPTGERTLRTFTHDEFDALTTKYEASRATNGTATEASQAAQPNSFHPDVEAAAALSRIQALGEQRQAEFVVRQEERYPHITSEQSPESNNADNADNAEGEQIPVRSGGATRVERIEDGQAILADGRPITVEERTNSDSNPEVDPADSSGDSDNPINEALRATEALVEASDPGASGDDNTPQGESEAVSGDNTEGDSPIDEAADAAPPSGNAATSLRFGGATRVDHVEEGQVILADGRTIPADVHPAPQANGEGGAVESDNLIDEAVDSTGSAGSDEDEESFEDIADRVSRNLGLDSTPVESAEVPTGTEPATPEVVAAGQISPEVLAILSSIGAGEQVNQAALQGLTPEQVVALATLGVTPDVTPVQPGTAGQEVAHPITEAFRVEQENVLATSLAERFGQRRQVYLERYAELKADDETKRWGRRKREIALKAAESALYEVELEYAKALVEGRRQNGLYENLSDEEALQRQSDHMFNQLRTIDVRARQATVDVRLDRVENRNILKKAAVHVGRFFNWGNNGFARHGKNFVTGFLATGVPLALGAAWPITLVAGAAGMVGRYGAVLDQEDRNLRSQIDQNGHVTQGHMTNEEFATFMNAIRGDNGSIDAKAAGMMGGIFDKARAEGRKGADEARKRASRNMTSFALGGLVGGFAGNWVHSALNPPQAPTPPAQPSTPAQPNEGTPPSVRYPVPNGHEFPGGADTITREEGWLHQFKDMGMSVAQRRELLTDHELMNKLVKIGAAYADNSSEIGGYGINMPPNGRLSKQAMDAIGEAMKARGW